MDRAERLLTLVAVLRTRPAGSGPIPLRELAAELGVSQRTVRRDVEALAAHGLGLQLTAGGVALAAPASTASPPVTAADGVRSMARPVVETVARAVLEHRVVRIVYTDETGGRSARDVEAHGLVIAPYGEYLVGWCRMREAPRTFRIDRIAAARLEAGRTGRRDLQELLGALRIPAPRLPPAIAARPGVPAALAPAQSRAWALERIRLVRTRSGEVVTEALAAREGLARLRPLLGHLAEWTRHQLADVRALVANERVLEGRRPALPPAFEGPLPYLAREAMIQDAMAVRGFAELARDLDEVLIGAAHWVADGDDALWQRGFGSGDRSLADLLAGWNGPLSHIEWHLDQFDAEALDPFPPDPDSPGLTDEDGLLVTRCPLRRA